MKEIFKKKRIYPFHFMYDTGILEGLKDVLLGKKRAVEERTKGFSDISDWVIEQAARPVGRAIWREMKRDARSPFGDGMAGIQTVRAFLDAMATSGLPDKQAHLAGHSTGAILLAALLTSLREESTPPVLRTCALMAPACTHAVFNDTYRPFLDGADTARIERLVIYNLDDDLERADTVSIYRKSLLYLVSNSFEDESGEPILGMQKCMPLLEPVPDSACRIEVSTGAGANGKAASTTHGGFDNDPSTMNDILRTILDKCPVRPFTEDDLSY